MGFLSFLKSVFTGLVVIIGLLIFLPHLPPTQTKFEYYDVTPVSDIGRELVRNEILNGAKIFVQDDVHGPESVAIRGNDIYTGDQRGRIVKVTPSGQVSTIAEFGFPCNQIGRTTCSMPLAMKFDPNGKLVFTDSFGGLMRLDVDTGKLETLVSRFDPIEGKMSGFPEDISIAKDGTIYWTDGTTDAGPDDIQNEILGHASGRLLRYDPNTNTSVVLVNGIHFANGVQLSENEDFVLVVDMLRFRIIRYYLKGANKGQTDIFLDGLSGFADNIAPSGRNGYYVSVFRERMLPGLTKYPTVRKVCARFIALLIYSLQQLHKYCPSIVLDAAHQLASAAIKPLGSLISNNACMLEIDNTGHIIRELRSTNGKIFDISEVTLGPKYAYFVGPMHNYIWYMPTKDFEEM